MSLALSYNLRHLFERKLTSAMTVAGVALVVIVFVGTLMLSNGLEQTLAGTGSPGNVIVISTGAENEIQSGIPREDAKIILSQHEVFRRDNNAPIASTDTVVVVSLKKRSGEVSNVTVRGTNLDSPDLRSGLVMLEGRRPQPGTNELMVGSAVRTKFEKTQIGSNVRIVGGEWPIVGVFDAGKTGFSSEIWGDVDILMPAFRRPNFSSVTFRLAPDADLAALKERLATDKRLGVSTEKESDFYARQSRTLAMFIRLLGSVVSVIFSMGAILGAMITMYSSVANRTREIGMLRAIGFSARRIFGAFAAESLMLALIGGIIGVIAASLLSFLTISTTNFDTFAEVAFSFRISPLIAFKGIAFSALMGLLGGALPCVRAARLPVLDALRST